MSVSGRPSFLSLTFPSHEDAWAAFLILNKASQLSPDLSFFPSWIRSSWYSQLMTKAREARRNSKVYLERVSKAVETADSKVAKGASKLERISLAYQQVDKDGIPISTQF